MRLPRACVCAHVRGTERLRFTPGPTHTAEMMDELTSALVEIFGREELREAA